MSRIKPAVRQHVRWLAQGLCECCHSSEDLTGHEFTIDHIVPDSAEGGDDLGNLWLCCFWCNNYKQAKIQALDPRTDSLVPLFVPRSDHWRDHFCWNRSNTRIIGRTAVGRATIIAIRLNRANLVRARKIWVRHGLHPPSED